MKAKKWMEANKEDYRDKNSGEILMTPLAEACAIALYDRAAEDEEFEVAFEVADADERAGR